MAICNPPLIPDFNNFFWKIISSNYSPEINTKLILTGDSFTLTLPASLGDIEFYNFATGNIIISLDKYKGTAYSDPIKLQPGYTKLIYFDTTLGWYPLVGSLILPVAYPSAGMALLLDGGSLFDKSGNGRNASPLGENVPANVVGLDGNNVLRFNGSATQELTVTSFLSGTQGATLYCVFTLLGDTSYNLIRTSALDDYWKFFNDGNGYIGTFRGSRFEGYPGSMPGAGSHLISIHAASDTYEVFLDTGSAGLRNSTYTPGDRFRIVTNDKSILGDIALILVYSEFISPASEKHIQITNNIKTVYPSLPFLMI